MTVDLHSSPYPPPSADSNPAGDERLRIAGLTGVDIGLEIAGPGSRSYAFLIDWHIRVLLALAWFAATWLVTRASTAAPGGRRFLMLALIPALVIYLFYQPVMELATRGRSPGKRMAGVRLVTRRGGTPGVAALLFRNVFRLVDSVPSLYLVGLICCFVTRQRVRIGDLAAGTLLVTCARAEDAALTRLAPSESARLPLALIELTQELLDRWSSLSEAKRREFAEGVLARAGRGGTSGLSEQELHAQLRELLADEHGPGT